MRFGFWFWCCNKYISQEHGHCEISRETARWQREVAAISEASVHGRLHPHEPLIESESLVAFRGYASVKVDGHNGRTRIVFFSTQWNLVLTQRRCQFTVGSTSQELVGFSKMKPIREHTSIYIFAFPGTANECLETVAGWLGEASLASKHDFSFVKL